MTEYRKGALRARLDRGNLQRADVWVSVRDNAGNEAAGTPSRFTLTSVSSGGRRKRVSKGQVRVRFGRTARIRGRLAFATGQPLAGVPVSITSAPASGGVPVAEGSAQTNASGRFGITVPEGAARMLTIASPGAPGSLRTERRLRLSVPASSSIRASRTRLSGAGRVRFSGRVRGGRPRPDRRAPGPRGRQVAHVRRRADGRRRALERELPVPRPRRELRDPGADPQAGAAPVRRRSVAGAPGPRGLRPRARRAAHVERARAAAEAACAAPPHAEALRRAADDDSARRYGRNSPPPLAAGAGVPLVPELGAAAALAPAEAVWATGAGSAAGAAAAWVSKENSRC